MSTRSYTSHVRSAAAAEKRERAIQAAAAFLRESGSAASFSLDTVAKLAGVTRLTLYNQFGSRRGLLEAVFDDIAQRGRLVRLKDVAMQADPRQGLDQMIGVFCEFWSHDAAVERLHEAMVLDPEFAQALIERNERRRGLIRGLVDRIASKSAGAAAKRDVVDLIFAMTSMAMYRMLSQRRSAKAVEALIRSTVHAALDRLAE